ncbi:hypothetical protein [Allomuricauda sp. SCSIO 65647]|uniref:hypothetical protein n=1 Tax=Allomuricauda sp. SCSIO 65647 TaxID=2908843 RepID=UPI001F39A851|nr:hypothetical protein [Muricauda sp. SCSIO 65647]UJH67834.1 hypothetical protein L0P89_01115 [Muricauda sp. SCSIO 65647]
MGFQFRITLVKLIDGCMAFLHGCKKGRIQKEKIRHRLCDGDHLWPHMLEFLGKYSIITANFDKMVEARLDWWAIRMSYAYKR